MMLKWIKSKLYNILKGQSYNGTGMTSHISARNLVKIYSAKNVLKIRREQWEAGELAHAVLMGQKEASLQIIEADINAIHESTDEKIYVFVDFQIQEDDISDSTPTGYIPRYRELQLLDRCEVFSFNKLTDKDFLEKLFDKNNMERTWIYIMDVDTEECTDAILHKIELLTCVGRQYNIIITLASRNFCLGKKREYLKGCIASACYYVVTPEKNLNYKDVETYFGVQDASFLAYREGYEKLKLLQMLMGTSQYSIKTLLVLK